MIDLEFSRPVLFERLGHDERFYEIEASTDECRALAERYGILDVKALRASIRLKRAGSHARLEGHLEAEVVQACVVTLDPVPEHVDEAFELTYTQDADGEAPELNEIVVEMEGEDPPEPIDNGIIDIGEATAEHLALALNPFPRVPGAVFTAAGGGTEQEEKASPFAALAALKKK